MRSLQASIGSMELLRTACEVINSGLDDLSPQALKEVREDITDALGGIPRSHRNHPQIKKLHKDIARALNSL